MKKAKYKVGDHVQYEGLEYEIIGLEYVKKSDDYYGEGGRSYEAECLDTVFESFMENEID